MITATPGSRWVTLTRLLDRVRHPGLATRIGLAMVVALVCLQVLSGLAFVLSPEGRPRLYSAPWLAATVADAAALAASTSPAERAAALGRLPLSDALRLLVVTGEPADGEIAAGWPLGELKPMIEAKVGAGRTVVVRRHIGAPRPPPPLFGGPQDNPIGAVAGGGVPQPDIVFPDFSIGVDLGDGQWLQVTPAPDPRDWPRLLRIMALLAGSVLLVALVAVRTAKGLVSPLQRLAHAAERLGRERVTTPLDDVAIPEVAAIARAFDEMQARITRFVDDRTLMLAAVSHDLRTPLTRLRLLAEGEADAERRAASLASIAEMEEMVSATLAFASDDSRREPHERVDVAALAISLCDSAEDAGQAVSYRGPDHAVLPCAPGAIRRALSNLIDNAVTYGQTAEVTLVDDPRHLVVEVADRGPGIPDDLVEHAFRPFARLEGSRNRDTGGVGLGLAIVRDAVQGHGGEVTLAGRPGGGLVARVVLPKPDWT